MTTLDTDILVSLLKGDVDAVDKVRTIQESGEQISTTMITAYELTKGANLSSKVDDNIAKVRDALSRLSILDLSLGSVEEASRIYKDLRSRGRPIGEFDVLIAGIVNFNDERLVTRDEHFKAIRGMKLVAW